MIDTPRVRLVPLTVEAATAIVNGHRPDERPWADGYPTDAALVAAGVLVSEGRVPDGFGTYQLVRRADDCVIGSCGYFTGDDGSAMVGFSVADSVADEGWAAEGLRALVQALQRAGAARVAAEAAGRNAQRLAVLSAAGLRPASVEGDLVVYEA
jgi:hypothetical protein